MMRPKAVPLTRFLAALLLGSLALALAAASPASARVHPDVWLRNEQGDRITPGENRVDPYSPRKSCGACHNYDMITSGYHFQQGFDEMSDRHDPKRPWILSPGMFGNWSPFAAAGRVARKVSGSLREIDLSTYDWIGGYGKWNAKAGVQSMACGACHPGGGPLEFGRRADGRRNLAANHLEAEGSAKSPLDGDYTSHLTPDGKSHFRESGVLEADCLICHREGYQIDERIEQINRRNYRWAATAGGGLGKINGAVFTYADPAAGPDSPNFLRGSWNFTKRPVVVYSWTDGRLFTKDGRLRGTVLSRSVRPENCLACHRDGDAKNTGTVNAASHDAHAGAGLRCTDCHALAGKTPGERLRHQIAKGWTPAVAVRSDLNGQGMKTCGSCHYEGKYRPSRPGMPVVALDPQGAHERSFPRGSFHFSLIACAACHATAQPARALALLDMSAGREAGFTADAFDLALTPADYDLRAREPWFPWMTRGRAGEIPRVKYLPHVPKQKTWFGERMKNGEIRPIPLRYVRRAAGRVPGLTILTVNVAGGKKARLPSVVTDADILGMIRALQNEGFRDVVFLSDRVYGFTGGALAAAPLPDAVKSYPVVHGVVPLGQKKTLGAKGCTQCHDDAAPFFSKMQVKNPRGFLRDDYPNLKEPNAVPQMSEWGLTRVPSYE
jgi:hypothetical protein